MMALNLTEEQILKLAPDDASVKAGKGLAAPSKWVLREYSDRALWGHCQGSGSTPYQTRIDLQDFAFGCSCPSRKIPCKHTLGLLLLYASQPQLFTAAGEPGWVSSWLAKRSENAEKKEQRKKEKTEAPVDEAAQAKRMAARNKKVLGGIDDLQNWLKDILRNGLLNVPERAYALFDGIAKRMIDAQAPGLAAFVRSLAEIDYYDDSWKYELTERLARLYLLAESYKNIDRLPDGWQQELRTLIGYNQSKEEILAGESVTDEWLVLACETKLQDRLTAYSYWLYGKQTNRYALYLAFVTQGNIPEYNLVPGCVINGEVCYYKGINPMRVLIKQFQPAGKPFEPDCLPDIASAMAVYRSYMQQNPFTFEVPLFLSGLHLINEKGKWMLTDKKSDVVPVIINEKNRIRLLAITGGNAFSGFILAHAHRWELKSIGYNTNYYLLKDEPNG